MGVPGPGQDAHGQHAGPGPRPDLQAHPVHARPDAVGHHRHARSSRTTRSRGERMFKFLPGPIFANIVLADEINRTPPKTQAALLEAMQERKASIGGVDHPMKNPFFVLATQNPIEQEGTYPLPEAQLDRFLFLIKVDYPTDAEEEQIMRHRHVRHEGDGQPGAARRGHPRAAAHRPPRAGVGQGVRTSPSGSRGCRRPGTPEAADFVQQVADLGRRPAGEHEPDPRREGARPAARLEPRRRRRRGRGRDADPAAPADPELRRPERGRHDRRGDPATRPQAAAKAVAA